jgi:uncharacterized cupin superfamily protein
MTTNFLGRTGSSPEEGIKAPCVASTTADITLSGTQTIDGVAVVAADRVLVRSQSDNTENGIYDVAAGAWARSVDFNEANDVVSGILAVDVNGANGSGEIYQFRFSGTYAAGTTALTVAAFASVTGAEAAQTAAELAETNAAASETAAGLSETAAELAETNAQTAQTAAELAETNSEAAQTAAELAETNAAASLATMNGLDTVASSATPNFDMNGDQTQTIAALTDNITPTLSNVGIGKSITVILTASGGARTIAYDGDWVQIGTLPTTIPSGKALMLSFVSTTALDTGVYVTGALEP